MHSNVLGDLIAVGQGPMVTIANNVNDIYSSIQTLLDVDESKSHIPNMMIRHSR